MIAAQPLHGSVVYNAATGLWDYHADASFVGIDYFSYRLTDGSATSPVVRVDIDVRPASMDPFFTDFPLIVQAPFDNAGAPTAGAVKQGTHAVDCWFVAAAASLAAQRPNDIRDMITVLPGDRFRVQFPARREAVTITSATSRLNFRVKSL